VELPGGWSLRPLSAAGTPERDADIDLMLAAITRAESNQRDPEQVDRERIEADLSWTYTDPPGSGLTVLDHEGVPVGTGMWFLERPADGDSPAETMLDLYATSPGAPELLLDAGLRYTLDVTALRGEQVRPVAWFDVADPLLNPVFELAGFELIRVFHRMRIRFSEDSSIALALLAADPHPPGLTLRSLAMLADGTPDPADLALAHELHEVTFADHFGFIPRDFDVWLSRHIQGSGYAPEQWRFAEFYGTTVGCLIADRHQEANFSTGYVMNLGVLPRFRGLGVARLLLLDYFARCQARGLCAAELGVDTDNSTGAVRLYESAGMSAVRAFGLRRGPIASPRISQRARATKRNRT